MTTGKEATLAVIDALETPISLLNALSSFYRFLQLTSGLLTASICR